MKKHHFICTIAVLLAMVANVQAQEERNKSLINSYLHGWEYNIKAGFNIGGTSPIPLPKEIRKIDSYAPGIAIAIEGNATKWFDEKKKWGLTLGLRLENKNMTTEATVKNYGMKIINTNGGELAGLWTGGVKTNRQVRTSPICWKATSPDMCTRVTCARPTRPVPKWSLPVKASQLTISPTNCASSSGVSNSGGEWKAFKHLTVHADVTWGLNNIFQKDFDTITFNMYPIYLNLGFGYAF